MGADQAGTTLRPPPGPRALPVLGSLHRLVGRTPFHIALSRLGRRHGDVCLFRAGSVPTAVLTHPAVMEEAFGRDDLSERQTTAHTNMSAERGLIFCAYPEPWHRLNQVARERLLSARNVAALTRDHLSPTVNQTMESIGAMADAGEAVAPHRLLLSSANDLCLHALFGQDEGEAGELRQVREELAENVFRYCSSAFTPGYKLMTAFPSLKFLFKGLLKESTTQRERRDSLVGRLLESVDRRRAAGSQEPACLADVMLDGERSGDLSRSATLALCVDVLVNAPAIASTVDWTLLLVANRPDVQAGIQQELDRVVGRHGSPDEDHRTLLPYTFACIAESMRYRPVSPLSLPHLATTDTEIGGYRIPAGTQVFGGIHSVHHDERFWESPDEFVPERFLPQADGSPSAALASPAYMPFGVGIRRCAGRDFSIDAVWLLVARMFHRFHLELPSAGAPLSEEEVFDLFVSPHPYVVRVSRRDG